MFDIVALEIVKELFVLGIDNSAHLSYRPEEENATASSHSNEPGDDTFSPRSLLPEEEQVCSVIHQLQLQGEKKRSIGIW